MIIKRPLPVSLFLSRSLAAADSFLKTNLDFPIRGRDLRPPVSLGHLFCALSRLPPLRPASSRTFFLAGPAKEVRAFLLPPRTSHKEDSLTASLFSCAKWILARTRTRNILSLSFTCTFARASERVRPQSRNRSGNAHATPRRSSKSGRRRGAFVSKE